MYSVEDLPAGLTGEALMKCVRKLISEEAYTHAEWAMCESMSLEVQGFQMCSQLPLKVSRILGGGGVQVSTFATIQALDFRNCPSSKVGCRGLRGSLFLNANRLPSEGKGTNSRQMKGAEPKDS